MGIAAIVFLVCAVTLLYVVAGYPLVLWLIRRNRPVRTAEPQHWPTVTVILPVRNGQRWLHAKITSILDLDYPADRLEIIVVSDQSTDATLSIGRQFQPRVLVLENPASGKATAINAALQHARGDILFLTDVRQSLDHEALKKLICCFEDPEVGSASGELVIRSGNSTEEENVSLYWRYEKWIRRCHSRIDSLLGATGAIYAIRRELARPLPPDTLLDDVHMPLQAFFKGYRVVFEPQARAYDDPTELHTEFRRKVRTLAGVYQVIAFYPRLLGPRNRMWFHFISHKVARLLLPFALIGMFVSSFFLPWPWPVVMVSGQVLFYTLAAIDPFVPESALIKRLTSVIRTFVVLVLATLAAASILFRPSGSFWKLPTKA